MAAQTLYDKIWTAHEVRCDADGTALLYIDRHLVHEVTSPQAFDGLQMAGRGLWRKESILAVPDHNIPTKDLENGITDEVSRLQVETLDQNCDRYGLVEFKMGDSRQGIVHVIGPEQGAILPGMTVVCGDSHTTTHGAFGALAFGIGTSEVEHVMATQCLIQNKAKNMRVTIDGPVADSITAKDIVLRIIAEIGTAGGTGHTIEFAGEAITVLSMEGRMTLCNMTIEAGARAGLVACDQTTIDYIRGRPFSPSGENWDRAVAYWQTLHSDQDAGFDREVHIDGASIEPQITWGTSPEMAIAVNDMIPDPATEPDEIKSGGMQQALNYMGLQANVPINQVKLDKIFIGSCTNARIEDLRAAAQVAKGRKVADNIKLAMVVPGSRLVKQQAESEGLDRIFIDAGFEWREPGCSMC
ncbi:MAG: 3-isopropylmalate dehydratase large subunit, partial [Gammaproteobacteria bacterium]